jgi:hypothetical protein
MIKKERIITERNVLVDINHPFIVKLAYSF